MPLKTSFKEMNLGAIYKMLGSFAKSPEVEQRLSNMFNIAIVTLGQGGGRQGAELSRFGFDLWMVNSARVDMDEHDWIERKIFLTDPDRGKLEGTAKNAAIGHQIAQKNVNEFKKIAVETQDADLVIVNVALGGGQGNGSIPTAIEWISRVREMAEKFTEKGNPTIVVVPSLPARDESNPDVWKNALAGLKSLQKFVDERKVGAILPVDNQLIANYYERNDPLVVNSRTYSALDYSNIMFARSLFETLTLPLLSGQVSMDSAELLEILSTPGWLTVNRKTIEDVESVNMKAEIEELFLNNEVFATLDVKQSLAGGIALITNKQQNLPPSITDSIKPITNSVLGRPSVLHNAIIESNTSDKSAYLLGLAVTPSLPETTLESLVNKYEEEKRREEEKRAARKSSTLLDGIEDVFSAAPAVAATGEKKRVSLEDLLGGSALAPKKKITLDDIQ